MRNRRQLLTRAMTIVAVGAVVTGSGCSLFTMRPGGNMRSEDMFTYISTPYQPLTVTLIDTRDNQEFWSVDVPIGKKLTIRFYEDKGEGSDYAPDVMRWQIYDEDMAATKLRNQIPVPGSEARRIDVALREGPEYPESIQATRSTPRGNDARPPYVPSEQPAATVAPAATQSEPMIDVGVATGEPEPADDNDDDNNDNPG
ncbi:MAG: hypothetical protein R3B57_03785 [Phycisphaerales bacterium]